MMVVQDIMTELVINDPTLQGFGAQTIPRTSRDQVTVMTVDKRKWISSQ